MHACTMMYSDDLLQENMDIARTLLAIFYSYILKAWVIEELTMLNYYYLELNATCFDYNFLMNLILLLVLLSMGSVIFCINNC